MTATNGFSCAQDAGQATTDVHGSRGHHVNGSACSDAQVLNRAAPHLLTRLRSSRACSVELLSEKARRTMAATRSLGTCARPTRDILHSSGVQRCVPQTRHRSKSKQMY